jgi:hypothetical protein
MVRQRPPRGQLLLLVASAGIALICAAATDAAGHGAADALDALDEPWRTGARERQAEHLQDVLSSLGQVREAESKAAGHEKAMGDSKLQEAGRATQEATQFMAKAEKLLLSEQALKEEQAGVERRLHDLEAQHSNVKPWADCAAGDDGCSRDEWAREEDKEHSTHLASRALERLRDMAMLKKQHSNRKGAAETPGIMVVNSRSHSGRRKRDKTGTPPKDKEAYARMRRPPRDSSKFDSRPEGHPYGDYQWKDEKPAVQWSTVKQGVLKAGYDLSNCFVAAAKDKGMVTVKILDRKKITIQKTLQKCTCKFPWKYVREAGGQNLLCFWRVESWFALQRAALLMCWLIVLVRRVRARPLSCVYLSRNVFLSRAFFILWQAKEVNHLVESSPPPIRGGLP